MIWATRSRSHSASGPSSGISMRSSVRWSPSAGRNSPTTERVSSARSTGSVCSSTEPESSRDRSSRSTDSFCRRSTCSRIVSTNSRRVSSSRSSSWSSSTKPASEKIGVRSSCEAVAMNSLRAMSTSRSFCCMALKVRVSWPSSSSESTGSGSPMWPRATSAAARSTRRTRPREPACDDPASDKRDQQRGGAGPEHAPADEGDGLGDLLEVARVEGHPLRVFSRADGLGDDADVLALEAAEAALRASRCARRAPARRTPSGRPAARPSRCAGRTRARAGRAGGPPAAPSIRAA